MAKRGKVVSRAVLVLASVDSGAVGAEDGHFYLDAISGALTALKRTDRMNETLTFGWLPYVVGIGLLVLLAAALDTLHAIRRDLTRMRRDQEPRTVVVPRPVEIRARRGREEAS